MIPTIDKKIVNQSFEITYNKYTQPTRCQCDGFVWFILHIEAQHKLSTTYS